MQRRDRIHVIIQLHIIHDQLEHVCIIRIIQDVLHRTVRHLIKLLTREFFRQHHIRIAAGEIIAVYDSPYGIIIIKPVPMCISSMEYHLHDLLLVIGQQVPQETLMAMIADATLPDLLTRDPGGRPWHVVDLLI